MIYLTKLPFLCGHDGNHIIFCCWCIRLLQEIIKHKNKIPTTMALASMIQFSQGGIGLIHCARSKTRMDQFSIILVCIRKMI